MGLCHQGWRPLAEEPPWALRKVDCRLTRNHEKLANAGCRCWKDSSGRKRSFRTTGFLTLYQERIGHRLARDPETLTWRIWMDNVKEDPKEKTIENYQDWYGTKNKKKSGGVLREPHRRHSRWRRYKKKKKKNEWFTRLPLSCKSSSLPRQQKFRAMNGAHLASPIRGELGYAHRPQLGSQIHCPIGNQIWGH